VPRGVVRLGPWTLSLMLLLATGCGDAPHLGLLQRGLREEFHHDAIGVSLTDGLILTVTFVDGPWAEASCEAQARLAFQAAEYVRDHYLDFDSLLTVSIAFGRRESTESSRVTSTHLPFRFARTSLEAGLRAADKADAVMFCRETT